MYPVVNNSAVVETIPVIGTKCLQRLQYVADRKKIRNVLVDLCDDIRDLIDQRLVLRANRQPGAVDERVGNAVQTQQIVPQTFRVVEAGTYLIEGIHGVEHPCRSPIPVLPARRRPATK